MHCLAIFRIAIFGAALGLGFPAHAGSELDALVEDHVMARFNQQARAFIKSSGARFVSSRWNRETRTLIAVAELERRMSGAHVDVALATSEDAQTRRFKSNHVAALCRHPNAKLINRFLEKYGVTIELVYGRKYPRAESVVVEISHNDLRSCV